MSFICITLQTLMKRILPVTNSFSILLNHFFLKKLIQGKVSHQLKKAKTILRNNHVNAFHNRFQTFNLEGCSEA